MRPRTTRLLCPCRSLPLKRLRLHDAFALFYNDQLIGFDVLERVHLSARPANLDHFGLAGFSQAEVNPQIVLRDVAAAAAHFVDLLVRLGFVWGMADAHQPCSDAAAVRLGADALYLDPVVVELRVAT